MSGRDAFEEEMGFMRRISDGDAERLLAGRGAEAGRGSDLDEVGSFLGALRVTVPVQPDHQIESLLVRRLAETARSARDRAAAAPTAVVTATGAAPQRVWRPRLALAAKVAFAVALLPALMAGLAFAGVTLPEPAREAMKRIRLDLPNQSAVDEPTADDDGDDRASSRAREGSAVAGGSDRGAERGKSAEKGKKKGKGSKGQPGAGRGNAPGGQSGQPSEAGPPIVPPGQGGAPQGNAGDSQAADGLSPPAVSPGQAKKP